MGRLGRAVKQNSTFYSASTIEPLRSKIEAHEWARAARDRAVEIAQPWFAMSDDALWELMFGATLPRSWMVWSNGHCPSCDAGVPMYEWVIDALNVPWSVACPHCHEMFPKNDFEAFYRSGLDESAVFDPTRADRALLFNIEHPDNDDPLPCFCMSAGSGFTDR